MTENPGRDKYRMPRFYTRNCRANEKEEKVEEEENDNEFLFFCLNNSYKILHDNETWFHYDIATSKGNLKGNDTLTITNWQNNGYKFLGFNFFKKQENITLSILI